MGKAYKQARRKFEAVADEQLKIMLPLVVSILWNEYGWRKERIYKRLNEVKKIWIECDSIGAEKSLVQMFDEETGIELLLYGTHSYHNYFFLDGNKPMKQLTEAQSMLVLREIVKWIPVQILACIGLALYRVDGWSAGRLGKLIGFVEEKKAELGDTAEPYRELLETTTEITLEEIVREYLQA